MKTRVVITGLGVVAPNGVGVSHFLHAIQNGISGIEFDEELEKLNFSCQVSGKPKFDNQLLKSYFSELEIKDITSSGVLYGLLAGIEAWKNAGLSINETEVPLWDSGVVFGSGSLGVEKFRDSIYKIDQGNTRRLGSAAVIQTMSSSVSALLAGKIGLGNLVTSNSSACVTGLESVLIGFERIKNNQAKIMLVGSTSDSGPYIWGGFDAMKVCTYKNNLDPKVASRPMSATASGFVPGSGAGALVIETLESALARKATIYAEIMGGSLNSGGQRGNGTMTAPNEQAVIRCITDSLANASILPSEVDYINGHLTATSKDSLEILNWSKALKRDKTNFPYINSLKSHTGHCLSASGSIELVGVALQVYHDFIFPNLNCNDLHPEIDKIIDTSKVPIELIKKKVSCCIKASFGFGDINGCIIINKYKDEQN